MPSLFDYAKKRNQLAGWLFGHELRDADVAFLGRRWKSDARYWTCFDGTLDRRYKNPLGPLDGGLHRTLG